MIRKISGRKGRHRLREMMLDGLMPWMNSINRIHPEHHVQPWMPTLFSWTHDEDDDVVKV